LAETRNYRPSRAVRLGARGTGVRLAPHTLWGAFRNPERNARMCSGRIVPA